MELVSGLLGLILLEKTIMMLLGKFYGTGFGVGIIGVLMLSSHTIGTLLWFSLSEASFDSNCGDTSLENSSIYKNCADDGPTLAIANILLISLSLLILRLIYSHRDPEKYKHDNISFQIMVYGIASKY